MLTLKLTMINLAHTILSSLFDKYLSKRELILFSALYPVCSGFNNPKLMSLLKAAPVTLYHLRRRFHFNFYRIVSRPSLSLIRDYP